MEAAAPIMCHEWWAIFILNALMKMYFAFSLSQAIIVAAFFRDKRSVLNIRR